MANIGFLSLTMWGCVGMMTWLGALGKSPSGGGEFASISSYHGTSISHIMMIVILTYDDHHTLKKHKISNIQLLEWAIPPALLHVTKKNASSRKVRQSELETLLNWWNHYQSYISHISVLYQSYIIPISVIYLSYISHTSAIFKSYFSHISVLYRSYISPISVIYQNWRTPTQYNTKTQHNT